MEFINLNVQLNEEQTNILNFLEKNTFLSKEELVNNIISQKRTWEDYREINEILQARNEESLSNEEVGKKLDLI